MQEHYLRGVVVDEIVAGYRYASSDPSDRVLYSFHHDQVNSVTALSGHAGSVEEKTLFDAFGAPLNLGTPGTGNDMLFTGREYDRSTGLYYYRARYYDPEIGRFLTEDPAGFRGGINFYAYVGNNPLNRNDPSGLVEQHVELSGWDRVFREVADIAEFEISAGWQLGVQANLFRLVDGGVTLDLGTGRTSWSNAGYQETYTTSASANLSVGLPGCGVCTIGFEGTSPGYELDYIPLDPHYTTAEAYDLLLSEGTRTDADLSGQFLGYGSISAADTDLRLAVGGAAIIGGSVGLNVSEVIDAFGQAYDYVDSLIDNLGDVSGASGGFVLYPSKPNLNSIRAYSK